MCIFSDTLDIGVFTMNESSLNSRKQLEEFESIVVETISTILHMPISDIDKNQSFQSLGVDSISAVELARNLALSWVLHLSPQWCMISRMLLP